LFFVLFGLFGHFLRGFCLLMMFFD
jgi:hypothetical protein